MKLTGYAQALKQKGQFPLKPSLKWRQREDKHPATSYLVIPNYSGDSGRRPIDKTHDPDCSAGIEILEIGKKNPVPAPVLGHTYELQCHVINRGAVGCYAGIAEFYTATPSALDALANGTGSRPAPLGYAGLVVAPGGEAVVQHEWTFTDMTSAILVRAYDTLVDIPQLSYNYATNPRVARRDLALLDQVNAPQWTGGACNVIPVNNVSQIFTPTLPTLLAVEIGLRTGTAGSGGDTVTMEIFDHKIKIFSDSIAVAEGFDDFLRFNMTPPLAVGLGKPLTIRVRDTGKNVFHWKYCGGNTYGRGNALFCGKPFDTNDFFFKTYGKK